MTTPPRVTRHALLVLTMLALAACAHGPSRPSATPQLATVPARAAAPISKPDLTQPLPPMAVVPLPGSESTEPEVAAAEAAAPAPAASLAPEGATQLAGLAPAQYGDLFDRMRAGFKLDDGADRKRDR